MTTEPAAGLGAQLRAALVQAVPTDVSRLVVAVSGGGDSLALLHVVAMVALAQGWAISAVTVDHRLRPEAAAEAAVVGVICERLGLPHQVLEWRHDGVAGNLMDAARTARRRLIGNWARKQGAQAVLLGHTADDQAEALVIGLLRGAGLDGLAGMRPAWWQDGLLWLRPLLGQGRAELRTYLRGVGVGWSEDPSNTDPRFTRARVRQAIAELAPLGITPARLAHSAELLAQSRAALVDVLAGFAAHHVTTPAGAVAIAAEPFAALHADLQRRLIRAATLWINGQAHAPRGPALSRLVARLLAGQAATLAGVQWRPNTATLQASREPRAAQAAPPVSADMIWDGRWIVAGPQDGTEVIRALGPTGLQQVGSERSAGVSRAVLLASPAVWQEDRLIAAPLAGFGTGWTARLCPDFASFLLTH